MKHFRLLFSPILLFLLFASTNAEETDRIWLSGEDSSSAVNWQFKISTGRNSGYWTEIPVPSNWEVQGFGHYTYGRDHKNYKKDPEIGYYKHRFNISEVASKRFNLIFEGSMTDTKVKVNGKSAGGIHQGGYMRFSYDITELLKVGDNLLEVEVSKSSANNVIHRAERVGDYWMFGGIFRPVYINVLPSEYINRVAINAKMTGEFTMDVYSKRLKTADSLLLRIVDPTGKQFGKTVSVPVQKGEKSLLSGKFNQPQVWSHEFPTCYFAEVSLKAGEKVLHKIRQRFGFRTFEVRDHDGFYLNGKRILLKGASMHSFHPETGRALSKENMLATVNIMKEMNFNTVRPCHYPPDDYFFDLCDTLGLLAYDEITGWTARLDKKEGARLVKSMIIRDVNHPSIVLWGNGNHGAHNPELDDDFFKWDIQQRRPLKNAARTQNVFDKYNPKFDIVNTTYYPSYDILIERLKGKHIVLPNECLHALYDGGGGASLKDFWDAFEASKIGGGIMIWALYDEGLVRTDKGNQIDVNINKAPDGLVGPYGEKEGSYHAVRDIWSPVKIIDTEIRADFNEELTLHNKFTFVDLNQCHFKWSLISFASPFSSSSGHRTIAKGVATVGSIAPGEKGALKLKLPANWRSSEALKLEVFDHSGRSVHSRCLPISGRQVLARKVDASVNAAVKRDPNDPFLFIVGDISFKFNSNTALLEKVLVDNKKLPISNIPYIVAQSEGGKELTFNENSKKGTVEVSATKNGFKITSKGLNGFNSFSWVINSNASLELDYEYKLPENNYYYAGIGMAVNPQEIVAKKWLGNGPYRVWKNRQEGGLLDVWDIKKQENIPGKIWNLPEFEGYFSTWYWALFRTAKNQQFAVSALSTNISLGVLNPINGEKPLGAKWGYPSKNGVYFFNCISPIGAKWKPSTKFGPAGQLNKVNSSYKGRLLFNFNINREVGEMQKFNIEIE